MTVDGFFYYEDKKVFYLVSDDRTPIKQVNGEDKMRRYITFYDDSMQVLESIGLYDREEILCNITSQYALEKYLNVSLLSNLCKPCKISCSLSITIAEFVLTKYSMGARSAFPIAKIHFPVDK